MLKESISSDGTTRREERKNFSLIKQVFNESVIMGLLKQMSLEHKGKAKTRPPPSHNSYPFEEMRYQYQNN